MSEFQEDPVARHDIEALGGNGLLANITALDAIDPAMTRSLLAGFGESSRSRSLGFREYSLLTIAVLTAIGDAGDQLLTYLEAATRHGVTAEEITDVINLVGGYAGAPRAVNAARVFAEYLGAERASELPHTTERLVRLRDHDTMVWDSGGDGTPMLLLHVLSMDRRFWRKTWSTLAGVGRVIAYDIRGHGYARGAPLTTGLDQLAQDTIDVLDALGVQDADVYGASFGGAIAQTVLLDHPHRVRSAALIATASNCGGPVSPLLPRADDAEEHGMEAQVPSSIIRWFLPETIAENTWAVRYARECVRRDSVAEWAAAWRAMAALNVIDRLPEISVPVIAVAGKQDLSAPPDLMREQMATIPNLEFVVVDPGTHMMGMEQPEAFSAVLRDFRLKNAK